MSKNTQYIFFGGTDWYKFNDLIFMILKLNLINIYKLILRFYCFRLFQYWVLLVWLFDFYVWKLISVGCIRWTMDCNGGYR